MNDTELVRRLREQDPSAVKQLHDCYLPSIWRFVYMRVDGDRHLAEDIVSESVMALLRALKNEETEIVHPAAWLRGVAAHKVQDHYRAAARVQHLIQQVKQTAPTADVDSNPALNHDRSERRAEVRQAMDALSEQHRLVLEWKYLDKLSVREIAQRLQTTEKGAESVLFRARRDLRSRLESESEEARESLPPAGRSSPGNCSARPPRYNEPDESELLRYKVIQPES